jgi:murein DD-endopeptidase MepM/ murein hydrolase activator NlpD
MPRKTIVWWEKAKLVVRHGIIAPRPIYAAAGLLLLAGLLMAVVAGGMQEAVRVPGNAVQNETADESQVAAGQQNPSAAILPQPPESEPVRANTAPAVVLPQSAAETSRWPIKGAILVEMGWRLHPVFHDWRYHNGIDIKGDKGQPVTAVLSGTVENIYTDKISGLTVVIKNRDYTFYYGCLDGASVDKNSSVQAGDRIGTVGSSLAEPYPHLHLAVKKGDKYLDPREILQ